MFRPVISRALGPTSVTRQRIHRAGAGGGRGEGVRRLLSSGGGSEGGSERPRFDLGWKDIAELNGRLARLEVTYDQTTVKRFDRLEKSIDSLGSDIKGGFPTLEQEIRGNRAETVNWIKWIIGFTGGTVLVKVFYYDSKIQNDMETRLQNAIKKSETKFAGEVRGLRVLIEAAAEKPAAKK